MTIEVFTQSAIKLSGQKKIYFDPFEITQKLNDADYIFITHDHYDHYDKKAIQNIMKDDTIIIAPQILEEEVKTLSERVVIVFPNQSYEVEGLKFSTVRAYNINKKFHPKEANYVGYLLSVKGLTYYIMGDTDALEENKNIQADVCFIPIGGHFTMDYIEASNYINELKPHKVIPTHYGSIIGSMDLGEKFKKLIAKNIEVEIYIKEEEK